MQAGDAGAPPTQATLRRLRDELRAQGGLLAGALNGDPVSPDGVAFGAAAAAGPRSAGRRAEIALVVETIREGFLLHYREGRLLDGDDADLMLLAGDHLYALGLARLAATGDLEAVAELADLISLCAQAHAEGRPELADAAWDAATAAIGWGAGEAIEAAKGDARAGDPAAAERLRAAARLVAGAALEGR